MELKGGFKSAVTSAPKGKVGLLPKFHSSISEEGGLWELSLGIGGRAERKHGKRRDLKSLGQQGRKGD